MTDSLFLKADWPAPAGVVAGTTLRGAALEGEPLTAFNLAAHVGDAPDRVVENRRRLLRMLNLGSEPSWLNQVHGTAIARAPLAEPNPAADASVATDESGVCAVLTADCLPVLLCRSDGRAWGAAHAGWRGLCAGVLEATVRALAGNPEELLAWLGPAISQPAFEVGDEVRSAFLVVDAAAEACFVANERGRWQADLYQLARLRLRRAGVRQIFGGGRCTYTEACDFYSHRRDPASGRMASLIFRRGSQGL